MIKIIYVKVHKTKIENEMSNSWFEGEATIEIFH